MQHNLEKRIRDIMTRFVAGKVSLRDFNRWFVPATWEIEEDPASLRELVYTVKALLDDYDNERLSKSTLRYRLSLVLSSYPVLETDEFTVRGHIVAKANEAVGSRCELFTIIRSAVAVNPPYEPLQPQSEAVRIFEPRFQEVLG